MSALVSPKDSQKSMVSWIMSITAIEYFIWGIVDPFYGLFVFEVVNDYGLVGLIFGLRTLVSLFAILFFERLFSVFSPIQNLFLVNIFMVIFSVSMFFAGFWHSVWMLILMTVVYGLVFSLKTSSRQNILRQEIPPEAFTKLISQSISLKYGAWILGMIVGGGIIMAWDGIPLYFLFLSIAGLWVFSLFPFFEQQDHLQKMLIKPIKPIHSFSWVHISIPPYQQIKDYFYSFPVIIRYNFSLFGFSEFLGRVTLLFVPILGQALNLHLSQIFWLTAFMISPMIFTQFFSWLITIMNKLMIIIISIALSLLPLWYLSTTNIPFWIAMCSFIISLSLAILQPALLGISQKYSPSIRIKETTKMEIICSMIGNFIGAIGIGYIAKFWSIEVAFSITACIALLFLIGSIVMKLSSPVSVPYDDHRKQEQDKKKIIEHTHFHFRRHFG